MTSYRDERRHVTRPSRKEKREIIRQQLEQLNPEEFKMFVRRIVRDAPHQVARIRSLVEGAFVAKRLGRGEEGLRMLEQAIELVKDLPSSDKLPPLRRRDN